MVEWVYDFEKSFTAARRKAFEIASIIPIGTVKTGNNNPAFCLL